MDAAGNYSLMIGLNDFNITGPSSTYTGDWLEGLYGMASMSVLLDYRAGTGGTDVRAYIQTSLDGGATAMDVACALFTTTPDRRVLNLSANAPSASFSATDGTLADDTQHDGVLGTMVRLKVVSTGTWVNTALAGRVVVR